MTVKRWIKRTLVRRWHAGTSADLDTELEEASLDALRAALDLD